jgi:hypothetical protein
VRALYLEKRNRDEKSASLFGSAGKPIGAVTASGQTKHLAWAAGPSRAGLHGFVAVVQGEK